MAKYEKTERLEKVPMEYLWEGLVLSDNLYNYNGSVLLVPSGEVITKSKLDKLINFRDRKSTRLNSSHVRTSRMPSSA